MEVGSEREREEARLRAVRAERGLDEKDSRGTCITVDQEFKIFSSLT